MTLIAHARIVMWEGGSLWLVDAVAPPDTRTAPHAHHAIQITLAMGGWIRFLAGEFDIQADTIAVAADVEHVFQAGGLMCHLFIDPDSRDGRTVERTYLQSAGLTALEPGIFDGLVDPMLANFTSSRRDDDALVAIGRAMVDRLTGGVSGDAPDLRVRKLIAAATQRIDSPISLSDFDGIGGLSASRLRHLFVEQTGLPFRTYLLWLRLSRALEDLAGGAPITAAAHGAGFADSAHFNRTFKRMFGVTPASLHMS